MRRKLLASLAVMTAGATAAMGQSKPASPPPPTAMMPSGLYAGPVQQAQMMAPPDNGMAPPMPMGGPPMGGPMGAPPMGDPAGGLFPGGMGPGMDCGPGPTDGVSSGIAPRWWFNGEFMLWGIKAQPANRPFVTTSAPGDSGVPGAPSTLRLYSTTDLGYGVFSGFRLFGGWYKDADRRCGYEIGGMLSENKTNSFFASSDPNGVPTLVRPFTVAGSNNQGVFVVSNLGLASGNITVASTARFYGAEASWVNNIYRSCPGEGCQWNTDTLFGFRFLQLREDLNFDSSSTIIGGGATFVGQTVPAGSVFIVHDGFEGWNQFYGGQLGIRSVINWDRCTIGASLKVAAGLMHQTMDITGSTTLINRVQGVNATAVGGVYATSQSIGTFKNDEFTYIPELNLSLGYQWCSWFSTYVGYDGIYINRVARPGNAIPLTSNPSLIPSSNNFGAGAVAPVVNEPINQTEFWIQGVSFGFAVRW